LLIIPMRKNLSSGPNERNSATLSPLTIDQAVENWIVIINQACITAVADIINTGRCFIRAKAELGHGRWGLLFGEGRLRYSQRWAESFMQIARCPVLATPQNFANLPGTWSVLHILSKVDVAGLQEAIAKGSVYPGMTLREARRFAELQKAGAANASGSRATSKFDPEQRLYRLANYLWRETMRWPSADRPQLAEFMHEIAADIAAGQYAQADLDVASSLAG
jgi:hypothetical protein